MPGIPGIACILSPSAGAVVVQHDGASAVVQQDDEVVEQQPQACAGAAAKAPTEVVANTIESNLNMQTP